jgi:hypothetical protein
MKTGLSDERIDVTRFVTYYWDGTANYDVKHYFPVDSNQRVSFIVVEDGAKTGVSGTIEHKIPIHSESFNIQPVTRTESKQQAFLAELQAHLLDTWAYYQSYIANAPVASITGKQLASTYPLNMSNGERADLTQRTNLLLAMEYLKNRAIAAVNKQGTPVMYSDFGEHSNVSAYITGRVPSLSEIAALNYAFANSNGNNMEYPAISGLLPGIYNPGIPQSMAGSSDLVAYLTRFILEAQKNSFDTLAGMKAADAQFLKPRIAWVPQKYAVDYLRLGVEPTVDADPSTPYIDYTFPSIVKISAGNVVFANTMPGFNTALTTMRWELFVVRINESFDDLNRMRTNGSRVAWGSGADPVSFQAPLTEGLRYRLFWGTNGYATGTSTDRSVEGFKDFTFNPTNRAGSPQGSIPVVGANYMKLTSTGNSVTFVPLSGGPDSSRRPTIPLIYDMNGNFLTTITGGWAGGLKPNTNYIIKYSGIETTFRTAVQPDATDLVAMITLREPFPDTTVSKTQPIIINYKPYNAGGRVGAVRIIVDGQLLISFSAISPNSIQMPMTFDWNTLGVDNGRHILTFEVDEYVGTVPKGKAKIDSSVFVNNSIYPTKMAVVTEKQTGSTRSVQIGVDAGDTKAKILGVDLYIDNPEAIDNRGFIKGWSQYPEGLQSNLLETSFSTVGLSVGKHLYTIVVRTKLRDGREQITKTLKAFTVAASGSVASSAASPAPSASSQPAASSSVSGSSSPSPSFAVATAPPAVPQTLTPASQPPTTNSVSSSTLSANTASSVASAPGLISPPAVSTANLSQSAVLGSNFGVSNLNSSNLTATVLIPTSVNAYANSTWSEPAGLMLADPGYYIAAETVPTASVDVAKAISAGRAAAPGSGPLTLGGEPLSAAQLSLTLQGSPSTSIALLGTLQGQSPLSIAILEGAMPATQLNNKE